MNVKEEYIRVKLTTRFNQNGSKLEAQIQLFHELAS